MNQAVKPKPTSSINLGIRGMLFTAPTIVEASQRVTIATPPYRKTDVLFWTPSHQSVAYLIYLFISIDLSVFSERTYKGYRIEEHTLLGIYPIDKRGRKGLTQAIKD